MGIFDLHSAVLADYRDFVRSFFLTADARARAFVDQALDEESRLWPDFLLQVSPSYARAATVDELAGQGRLHELHASMDRAILACYGWTDLDPRHGFHANERGQTRYTISPDTRRQILRRLLDLNIRISQGDQRHG
ncbi:MAG: hypothetical protein L6Q92_05795 [Phycisphaerae bacterium]|nr:hypothetical protein [Phycisphaerae bacterium]